MEYICTCGVFIRFCWIRGYFQRKRQLKLQAVFGLDVKDVQLFIEVTVSLGALIIRAIRKLVTCHCS